MSPDEGTDEEFDRLRRRVLWAMPTGLYVLGSRALDEGKDRCNLMTASLVVQVATEPKLVGVAIDTTAVTHRLVAASGVFAISLVERDDRALVRRYVKPVDPSAVVWEGGHPTAVGDEAVGTSVTGAPFLSRSAGWLDCEVRDRLDFASHTWFVAEVVAAGGPDGALPPVLRMEDTRMSYGG